MHVRQLTASSGITAGECITVFVNWLCWKCVINYKVGSAIFWDFTQRRMVILTTIVLLDPLRWGR